MNTVNLFDYIKYQNIDLSSAAELESLPSDLVELYWKRCVSWGQNKATDLKRVYLLTWGNNGIDDMRPLFLAALKEYCSEPV